MPYGARKKRGHPERKTRHPNVKGQPSNLKNPMYAEWIAIGCSIVLGIGLFNMLR